MTAIIPQLTQIQALTVTGISVRTKNEEELNPQKAQLPHLWEQFYGSTTNETQQNN
ncbi:TPA: AraC family transcriptional regulator, partial [Legionella pneumophila]|nr:AraC family transcriptional regulator [Legionella pneumophila]